jgi:hypothetical protein
MFPCQQNLLRKGVKMAKEIIIYNLVEHVTGEQYFAFVSNEKSPVLGSLLSVKDYELVRTKGVLTNKTPFLFI